MQWKKPEGIDKKGRGTGGDSDIRLWDKLIISDDVTLAEAQYVLTDEEKFITET